LAFSWKRFVFIIIWYFLACDKDIFVFLTGKKWFMEIEG